jgi:hypothetical protein
MRIVKTCLVCCALVLAAACGSSGSPKSSAPPTTAPVATITKARYIARANAICTVMNRKTRAVADPGADPVKTAAALDQLNSIIGNGLTQLRALPVPEGEGSKLVAVYAKVDALRRGMRTYATALRSHDRLAAAAAAKRLDPLGNAANAASNKYGLTVCGS